MRLFVCQYIHCSILFKQKKTSHAIEGERFDGLCTSIQDDHVGVSTPSMSVGGVMMV